jgi:phosphoribosylformylglycinamidine (FGAM) synthase-like enzyme
LGGSGQSLSGSEFSCHFETTESPLTINLKENLVLYRKLHQALQQGLIASAHDISEGGLLVAIAESMIGGRVGASLSIKADNETLFNETAGRILVSVSSAHSAAFENTFDVRPIGKVTSDNQLSIEKENIPLDVLIDAWKRGF